MQHPQHINGFAFNDKMNAKRKGFGKCNANTPVTDLIMQRIFLQGVYSLNKLLIEPVPECCGNLPVISGSLSDILSRFIGNNNTVFHYSGNISFLTSSQGM